MAEDTQETNYCSNCKRRIAAANFVMHDMHCRRNLVLCKDCDEPVPRSELSVHFDEYHAPVSCDLCKKQVEKSKLDDHVKDACPKRLLQCVYCEIDCPQCELQEHLGYCGTRTERCPKCSGFIMCKDQAKHDESNCSYPPPKPDAVSNNNHAAFGQPPPRGLANNHPQRLQRLDQNRSRVNNRQPYDVGEAGNDEEGGQYNTFAMDELSRILQDPGLAEMENHQDPYAAAAANVFSSSSRVRSNFSGPNPRMKKKPNAINVNPSLGARLNNTRKQKNVNEERDRARNTRATNNSNKPSARPTAPEQQRLQTDIDVDELLAMQMAQDMANDETDPFNTMLNPIINEELQRPTIEDMPVDDVSPAEDEALCFPCEFCEESIPVDQLIEHQLACSPAESKSPLDSGDNEDIIDQEEETPGANTRPRAGSPPPPLPAFMDTDAYDNVQRWLGDPHSGEDGLGSDEIMLPCEFCDQAFPEDLLIQHQAVCDSNTEPDPPRVSRFPRTSQAQARQRVIDGVMGDKPPARASRHQTGNILAFLKDDEDEEASGAANGRSRNSQRGAGTTVPSRAPRAAGTGTFPSYTSPYAQWNRPKKSTAALAKGEKTATKTAGKPKNYLHMAGGHVEGEDEAEEDGEEVDGMDRVAERRRGSAAAVDRKLQRLIDNPTYQPEASNSTKENKERVNDIVARTDSRHTTSKADADVGAATYQASFASGASAGRRSRPLPSRNFDADLGNDGPNVRVTERGHDAPNQRPFISKKKTFQNRSRGSRQGDV